MFHDRSISSFKFIGGLIFAAAVVWSSGCRTEEPIATPPTLNAPANEIAPAGDDLGATAEPASEDEAAEIRLALASLSPEDQDLALEQRICPVSGTPLGGMGTPIKISVEGHDIFICCEGCEQEVRDNAALYLTKLGISPATGTNAE